MTPCRILVLAAALTAATGASAQPTITSLGSVSPTSVSSTGGTWKALGSNLGAPAGAPGAAVATLTGSNLTTATVPGSEGSGLISADGRYAVVVVTNAQPNQVFGSTAFNVSPPFSTSPTLVSSAIPATEFCAGVVDLSTGVMQRMGGLPIVPELMAYGSGKNGQGGSPGAFITANAISQTGQYVVGHAFVSTYGSSAGTSIVNGTSFNWRPYICDVQAGDGTVVYTVLPTPFQTQSNTWRRRRGSAMSVSADGHVVVGALDSDVASSAGPDPDGARPVVWRWNGSTARYDLTYLPNGALPNGDFPGQRAITFGQNHPMFVNPAGTVIVGPAVTNGGVGYIAKWVWNAGTSSWSAPVSLGSMPATPSWLPPSFAVCWMPPDRVFATGMSDDGSMVVGTIRYTNCSSGYIQGGWVWTAATGMTDWYDYLAGRGVPGLAGDYGPAGESGNPAIGQPSLGQPTGISGDGSAVVGVLSSQTPDLRATPWMVRMAGGASCVAPQITAQPGDIVYSHCNAQLVLDVAASGTGPLGYQWRHNGVNLVNGPTGTGSTIEAPMQGEPFGANEPQLRITNPGAADAGSYDCVITGCNGQTVTSVGASVQLNPAPSNNSCATAMDVGEGTATFNLCSVHVPDGFVGCTLPAETGNVWYRYTPSFTGDARFQTCGSGFDSAIQILGGCNGPVLACSNDVGNRGLVGVNCPATRSLINRFPVTAGVPVLVRVSSIGPDSPTGVLTISWAPPPPDNDLCANATPVGVGQYVYDLGEATDDFTIGTNVCNTTIGQNETTSTRDVWFRLDAPAPASYTISTCDLSDYRHIPNPMLHVMSDCTASQILACHDNNTGPVAGCALTQARIVDLPVGGSVLIRIAHGGPYVPSPSGVGVLTITSTPLCGTSDFNGDGDYGTDQDIEAFFACLGGSCCATCFPGRSDFNGDGDYGTDQDIEAFFRVLGGHNC